MFFFPIANYNYWVSVRYLCLDPKIKPKLLLIAGKIKLPRRDSQTCQVCQITNERDCASSHPSAEGLLNTLNPAAPFSWPRWVRQGQGVVCKPTIPRKPGSRIGIKDQLVQWIGLVWCFEDGAGGDLVVLKPGWRARVIARKQTSHRDAGVLVGLDGVRWAEQLRGACATVFELNLEDHYFSSDFIPNLYSEPVPILYVHSLKTDIRKTVDNTWKWFQLIRT